MKKSILFASLVASLVLVTSCSSDDDNDSGTNDLEALLDVVTYNSPQNLSADRSNPDRLSLDSPGEFFEVDFVAPEGANMNFVSMSSISNDWLFAPRGVGINLFDNSGEAILGDITNQILLWDAGTEEENVETRGGGAPELREDDDNPNVRVQDVDVSDYIRVELVSYNESTRTFTMAITNLRGEFADEDPIRVSPGVVVLQGQNGPFFSEGEEDRGEGLQLLAERGDFSELEVSLNSQL